MSSICGLYRPEGPAVEAAEIEAMVQALDYWSADARGSWTSGRVAFGHLLLSTTASSGRERLPVSDDVAGLAITGDCRLDNRADLADRLDIGPSERAGLTDETLVLRAYRRWGEQCLAHLLGDFAFAIWDGPRHQVFCARDPFGVKPFYYYARGGLFAFATEMRGLLALSAVDRTVDETWIGDYLHFLNPDLVSTFYTNIKRLAPANALTFETAEPRTWQYWALDPHRELRLPRDSDYVEAFREKLVLAVRRRTETQFEMGAELSGGLDSTGICAIAQEHLQTHGRDLQTFSQVLPEGTPERPEYPIDARWAIDLVCQHARITRTCFLAGEGGVLPALEWACRHFDEPPRSFASLDYHDLYEAAAERGVRVLLSGFGGNSGVSASGGRRLHELVWSGHWTEFMREISAIEQRPLVRLRAAVGAVLGPLNHPLVDLLTWSGAWEKYPTRPTRTAFARRIGMFTRTLRATLRDSAPGNLRQAAAYAMAVTLAQRLETSHVSVAARRMEYRYPLLDAELVALFVAMPSRMKFWRGRDRYVFRRSLEERVPDEVRLYTGPRASGNPGHPLRRERDGHALKEMLDRIPAEDPVLTYLDLKKLAKTPRVRLRIPRARSVEMMMALILTEKLRQVRTAPGV